MTAQDNIPAVGERAGIDDVDTAVAERIRFHAANRQRLAAELRTVGIGCRDRAAVANHNVVATQ